MLFVFLSLVYFIEPNIFGKGWMLVHDAVKETREKGPHAEIPSIKHSWQKPCRQRLHECFPESGMSYRGVRACGNSQ